MSEKRPPVDDDEAIRKAALERGEGVLRDQAPRRLSLAEREKMRRVLGVDPGGDVALHTQVRRRLLRRKPWKPKHLR